MIQNQFDQKKDKEQKAKDAANVWKEYLILLRILWSLTEEEFQEINNQLQEAGYWTDAATLEASNLKGTDYARALVLYIAAGSLQDALAALREAQQPDTAAMFIIACREIHAEFLENLDDNKDSDPSIKEKLLILPGLNPENEDVGEL